MERDADVAQLAHRCCSWKVLGMPVPRKLRPFCLCGCGRETARPAMKFFSNKCQQDFEYREYIERWKTGIESGVSGNIGGISNHIKRYLRDKHGNRCSNCGWAEKHPLTNIIPLEVNHLNGDWSDNREENLALLCPNCHALTPNYRALNKGNGRPNR